MKKNKPMTLRSNNYRFPIRSILLCIALIWSGLCLAAEHISPPSHMTACFSESAEKYAIPENLLIAVAQTESNFDPDAISHALAVGIMQIQWPQTAKHLGTTSLDILFDPCTNIGLGAKYLQELYARFGDWKLALAAYNYGPGRISSASAIPDGAAAYVARVYANQRSNVNTSADKSKLEYLVLTVSDALLAKQLEEWLSSMLDTLKFKIKLTETHQYSIIASIVIGNELDTVLYEISQLDLSGRTPGSKDSP